MSGGVAGMQIALANSHWPFLKRQRCLGLPSVTLSHNVLFPPSGNGGYNGNQDVFFVLVCIALTESQIT